MSAVVSAIAGTLALALAGVVGVGLIVALVAVIVALVATILAASGRGFVLIALVGLALAVAALVLSFIVLGDALSVPI